MENEKEMRERHKKELEDLQAQCPHTVISNWIDYCWAPGHCATQVKVCEFCGKAMDSQGKPSAPGAETTTTEANDYYLRDY